LPSDSRMSMTAKAGALVSIAAMPSATFSATRTA
jgi:hypothetical protein